MLAKAIKYPFTYNMEIHNKTFFYIGFALFLSGVVVDYSHLKQDVLVYALLISGIVLMLLSFKKLKGKSV
jgi:sugar phosphate permease